jgi:hypothetical protein
VRIAGLIASVTAESLSGGDRPTIVAVRRSLFVLASGLAIALAIGAGVFASETARSSAAELDAKLAATATALPNSWSVYHGPTSMNELSVPAWYRCLIPPFAVFGDAIANEQFRSKHDGESLSETIGMATTSDPTRALHLWRNPWLRSGQCVRGHIRMPRRTTRVVENAYFTTIRPFETGEVGWTGYSPHPPKPFTAPRVTPGAVLFRQGMHLTTYETWVEYGVLRHGYVVEIAATGRLTPGQVAALMHRLVSML